MSELYSILDTELSWDGAQNEVPGTQNISTIPGVKLLMEAAEVKLSRGLRFLRLLPAPFRPGQASGQPFGSPAQGLTYYCQPRLSMIQCSVICQFICEDIVPEMILLLTLIEPAHYMGYLIQDHL